MKWMSKLFPVPCLCLYLDKTSAFPTAGQQSISWALKGKKICTIDWESDIHTVERLWFCSSQGSFNGPNKYHNMIKPLIISRQAHHVFMATIVFTSSLWWRTNTDRYCCCGCHKWKCFHWEVLLVNNKVIFKALKHCHWLFLCHFHFHHVAFSLV